MSNRCGFGPAIAAVVATVLLAGCTSSGSPAKTQAAPSTTAPATTSSSSPVATPTVSPTATPTKAPLSAFEADPSVMAYRKWAYEVGRTINAGSYTSAALRALSGSFLAQPAELKRILGPDVGSYYPGPLPFQPVGVTIISATRRDIRGCLLANGWAQNPKTHKPTHPYQVVGARAQMIQQSGTWVVGAEPFDKSVSCKGVKVRTQLW